MEDIFGQSMEEGFYFATVDRFCDLLNDIDDSEKLWHLVEWMERRINPTGVKTLVNVGNLLKYIYNVQDK